MINEFIIKLSNQTDVLWTFMLLTIRFTACLLTLPGIGGGAGGLRTRSAAVVVFSAVSVICSPISKLPNDFFLIAAQMLSEFLLGSILALFPRIIVAGIELAAQLAGNTMGLGAGQLIDPTSGAQTSSLSIIYLDLSTLVFLFLGGHHAVIRAVAGLGSEVPPGAFLLAKPSLDFLIAQTGAIFEAGVMLSSPVVVALLLTQFVMGLISRSVSTVNIFILSFPITIGVGLSLCILSFPEVMRVMSTRFVAVEQGISVVTTQVGGATDKSRKPTDIQPIVPLAPTP